MLPRDDPGLREEGEFNSNLKEVKKKNLNW
jgi:hypothetical protein